MLAVVVSATWMQFGCESERFGGGLELDLWLHIRHPKLEPAPCGVCVSLTFLFDPQKIFAFIKATSKPL